MVSVCKRDSGTDLANELGEFIIKRQNEALLSKQDHFYIAISGGSLINVLKKCLIDNKTIAAKVKWPQWRIYFVDERIVPFDSPDSNYGAFKKAILDPLSHNNDELNEGPTVYALNESLVGNGAAGNEKVAEDYESLLPKFPFHLLLLGFGPDGHTCSLFPNPEHRYLVEERKRHVMYCHDSPKPPSDRITITLPVIKSANSIAFVGEGASKQEILHEIFDIKNEKLPTVMVNDIGKDVYWFVNTIAFEKTKAIDITVV
ncbi:hypothetical protein TBLA_0C06580 [Henningerozyma blattae CBS 6284]|uniref:6-phosphogluconolactonase-like protein n=1 Tax=Henningerozyma blattae (strain ATCC 34711 / CBS 6284 / DSM 70876 / NBRC 10599 / NRRL Y-10934 / UCD 77-7) TaxID=1071380 RepID=I2H249_HENB6|nr:hypothetical protein TBLA_0C06580 [Tetrapisispora blattae CBS 6284]CCH60451.1 hypothetical protein TBLA_0C06580 [Tetrapisispora blattae CBS 6284]